MPKIHVNGVQLYYEIQGQGMPLVLVAGLSCDISIWQLILEDLKAHFQLLIFDNRGVGRSDSSDEEFTIEDMAKDTSALIEKLGLKKPHILGHSMGGCIVQALVRQERAKFNKVILSNSLIKLNPVAVQTQKFFLKLREEGCSLRTLTEGILPWIYSSHFLADQKNIEELINQKEQYPYQQSLIGQKRQTEALFNFDSTEWHKSIKGPALVIGGDEDILCPRDSELLANPMEDAKFVEFHRVAHAPMIEIPKEYVGIVVNYLKG